MIHTCAFTVAIGQVADLDVPAVSDDVLTIQNNHFFPNVSYDLVAAAAMSATVNRAKIVSPSLRVVANPFIRPIILAALPPALPAIADYRSNPFQLPAEEELAIQGTSDLGAATERFNALLWLSNGITTPPRGRTFTIRGTSTTAAVANTWTSQPTISWSDTLPTGRYAVVGLNYIATNGVAARVIFPGQLERPGVLAGATNGVQPDPMFGKGRLGVLGYFYTYAMPIIQVFNNGTDAAHTYFLDLVKI